VDAAKPSSDAMQSSHEQGVAAALAIVSYQRDELRGKGISDLRAILRARGVQSAGAVEKDDLIELVLKSNR
jgi:hypothetical protein